MRPGDIVYKYHDSGAFGMQPMYAEIIRVNRKSVTVEWLRSGLRHRVQPQDLHTTHASDRGQILADEDKRQKNTTPDPHS